LAFFEVINIGCIFAVLSIVNSHLGLLLAHCAAAIFFDIVHIKPVNFAGNDDLNIFKKLLDR